MKRVLLVVLVVVLGAGLGSIALGFRAADRTVVPPIKLELVREDRERTPPRERRQKERRERPREDQPTQGSGGTPVAPTPTPAGDDENDDDGDDGGDDDGDDGGDD